MTINGLRLGIYESQILVISLYAYVIKEIYVELWLSHWANFTYNIGKSCLNLLEKVPLPYELLPSMTLTEVVTNDKVVEPYAGENWFFRSIEDKKNHSKSQKTSTTYLIC